jgi:hypothetical protein
METLSVVVWEVGLQLDVAWMVRSAFRSQPIAADNRAPLICIRSGQAERRANRGNNIADARLASRPNDTNKMRKQVA